MKYYAFCLLLLFCGAADAQQYQNILIDGTGSPNEPAIAIDPANPLHLVAGANLNNYYTSADGGRTWTRGSLISTYGVWGDPVITTDTSGSFYFFHLSNVSNSPGAWAGTPGWVDRMVCQRMDGFSGTWSGGTYTGLDSPKVQDKPGVCFDRRHNRIYLAWTQFDSYGSSASTDSSAIYFSSSSDRGQTWSPAARISVQNGDCTDGDGTVEGAVPCAGPENQVYVAWASASGIRFRKSPDGGQTWPAAETPVAPLPSGWNYSIFGLQRCNGLPYTACDNSGGPYNGNIYINWTAPPAPGLPPDVWLCRSINGGQTWETPLRINQDTAGIPRDQFLSSMTVDPVTGYIYVLYYDRRAEVQTGETEVYIAMSNDGGKTFIERKISSTAFIPDPRTFFGDYTGIAAYNNVVRPIWTRMDGGHTSIMTAIITNPLGVENSRPPAQSSVSPVYPSPFSDILQVPFSLSRRCAVRLYLTDITGRRLITLIDGDIMTPGSYTQRFRTGTAQLSPGSYFVVLETDGQRSVVRAAKQ